MGCLELSNITVNKEFGFFSIYWEGSEWMNKIPVEEFAGWKVISWSLIVVIIGRSMAKLWMFVYIIWYE